MCNKKIFSLLIISFVLPLFAMNGPEEPEKWMKISLEQLTREAFFLEINREEKIRFIQEQGKRYDDVWAQVKDLENAKEVTIGPLMWSPRTGEATYFTSRSKLDYTASDIDELVRRVKELQAKVESRRNPK